MMVTMTTSKLIHIFRAGRHTTAAGEAIEFSRADLVATAAAYDPAVSEAPLVIGHPKTDGPAYGWAKGMEVRGDDLYATPDQVNPEFAQMVRDGAFKKRSVKWFRPTDPLNPKPGIWYPQHIGFLGAAAPGIKGLRPVELSQSADLVEVEFGQWEDRTVARLFRNLREFFIGQFGADTADKVLGSYEIDALAEDAAREVDTGDLSSAPQFSHAQSITQEKDAVNPEEKAHIEAENATLKTQLAAANARETAILATNRKTAAVEFCESMICAGKVLPAEKDTVVGLLVMAAEGAPVEFAQGQAAEAPLVRLESFIKALPKRIELREVGRPESAVAAVEFSAPAGHGIDAERLVVHNKALAYQAAHPGTDYLAAVKAVQ